MTATQKKLVKFVLIIVGLAILAIIGFIAAPYLGLLQVLQSWRSDLEAAGVDSRLAFAFVTLLTLPFILSSLRMTSRKVPFLEKPWPSSKLVALIIVLGYTGGFSVLVWAITRDHVAGKYYCPQDLNVSELSGDCPVHMLPMQAVTASIARVVSMKRHGTDVTPRLVSLASTGPFYDAASGLATVYFGRSADGSLVAYSYPGRNPYDGEPLLEPTAETRAEWARQAAVVEQQANDQRDRELAAAQNAKERERRAAAAKPYHSKYERLGLDGALGRVAMEPDNADLHYAVGMLYRAQGDAAGSERSFREALRANPGFTHARRRLEEMGVKP